MLRNILVVLFLLACLIWPGLAASTNLNHDSAVKAFDLGLKYDSLGQISNATSSYRHAVGLDPEFAEAWYRLGLTLYAVSDKMGTSQQALDCFEKAAALDASWDVWSDDRPIPPITVNSEEDWNLYKEYHALAS